MMRQAYDDTGGGLFWIATLGALLLILYALLR
jgi:hypothetical protein